MLKLLRRLKLAVSRPAAPRYVVDLSEVDADGEFVERRVK